MSVDLNVLDEAILDVMRQDPTEAWSTSALYHQPRVQGALGLLGAFESGDAGELFRRAVAKLWVARFLNKQKTPGKRERYRMNPNKIELA